MKWNATNSEEKLKHWKAQINEKSEKINKWFHKVKRLNLKQNLKTYLQSADSVKQVYNKWKNNNNKVSHQNKEEVKQLYKKITLKNKHKWQW